MKIFRYLALSLILLQLSCEKASNSETLEPWADSDIKSVIDDFFTALGNADSTSMRKLVSEDFHMFEHDVKWNVDSLVALMPLTIGRKWEVRELAIAQDNELIHVNYFNQGVIPNDRSWFESMLIRKVNGELKIDFMHSTKLYLK
ncbi:hypothetical protein [Roseivirga misakiensis]|uniref:SnoaL-like domain-containing protein n=1 Tax=Roseivirga misakiensis TaxID=1563681 RepID=A0A1E5SZI2_9BACT|nr:hypothetical protein [Roseivirga misakiensis]OEK04467.1 hypothetical protein BFP71_13420 [Roseivirga misakiensis]